MPSSKLIVRLVPVLVIGSAFCSCSYQAGNDGSLAPMVARAHRHSDTLAVVSARGTQLAVFAAEPRVDGWSFRYLGSVDGAGRLLAPRYDVDWKLPSLARMAGPGTLASYTVYGLSSSCAAGLPVPDNDGGSHLGYFWGCSSFLDNLNFPSAPAPYPGPSRGTGTAVQYLLLVSGTIHLSDTRWQAIADSLRTVHRLSAAPTRLGHLAFSGDSTARWSATLARVGDGGVRWVTGNATAGVPR